MYSHSLFAAMLRVFYPVFYPVLLVFLLICFIFSAFSPTVAFAQDFTTSNHLGEVCFAIGDERNFGPQDPDNPLDTLTLVDPDTGATQVIGLTGTDNAESMSFGPDLQIYAADDGHLGIVDPMTGDFTATSQPFGQVNGSLGGNFTIGDVDGLAFSLERNILFGIQRRNDNTPSGPRPDFLFAIDPTTGAHIENYFGPNKDYVLVPPVLDEGGVPLTDVDDIQFNPVTGVLFGVMNTDGRDGVLVIIDVDTGASTPIATIRYEDTGEIIDDIEGMSFSNDGTLYVSTGDNYTGDADDLNRIFEIDPTTGRGHLVGPLSPSPTDYEVDFEALACLSSEAAIVLKKYTNGPEQAPQDADEPTGPEIVLGAPVTWTFIFTNTSVLTLTNLSLVDDKEGSIGPSVDCLPAGTLLAPGESLTCTATGIALEGQYENLATITGDSVPHPLYPVHSVSDDDPSHYFGRLPGISIIKFTNGEDADTPTGPFIPVGDLVTWTYEVRNTTDVPLSNVTVVDNIPGVSPAYVSGDTNDNDLLEPGEVWLFQATGTAVPGQYANIGTTTGVPPQGPPVTDTNPSHYFGSEPGIDIIKFTNGEDADTPTGPVLAIGDPVTWTYEVRNTGNVPLSDVTVTDNIPGVSPVYVSGDINVNALLDLDEVWLFRATGTAVGGQYANIGTTTGVPPVGPPVTDTNPSHYFASGPGIEIIKFTNGEDADTPTGPTVPVGDPVTWTYEVRNIGDVPLSNVTVVDNIPGVSPVYVSGDSNTNSLLDLDEVWLFQATGTAVPGQYANIGTTTGVPPQGPPVTDTNPSHYFGSQPGIAIIKFTNGEDADSPTGPMIQVGDTVTWTYEVRNTGNVALSTVEVTDNVPGVSPTYISGDTNNNSLLDLTEIWLFQATGTAVVGQYENIGTTTGTPPSGPPVTDTNPSHYFGINPGIEIIKFTNGPGQAPEDADIPTGPEIEIGDTVTWTYEVRNTGDVPLSNVTVTDDVPGVNPVYVSGDTNNNSLLDLTEVWLFRALGVAVGGQYANIGTVVGTPPAGPNVTDTNPSHYFGDDEGPTNLPGGEQPQQDRTIFLPSVRAEEN